MEEIFEAVLRFSVETNFGIVEETIGESVEYALSFDYLDYLNRRPPENSSLSNVNIALDVLNHNKEIFKK